MADYDLTDEEQIKAYLKNIEIEYTYQCLSEKEADGCHRLADYMSSIKKEEAMGAKLFKKNCDEHNFGHSCFKYAGQRYMGKGVEANADEGLRYFEKACKNGFLRGCSNAGILLLEGEKVKRDYIQGLKFLSLACEQGRGEACSTLGTGYLLGKYDLEKDSKKATALLRQGCELGSISGCVNLSRMYRTGDGVATNDSLAEKYKQLAMKIKRSLDGSKEGVQLGRGT